MSVATKIDKKSASIQQKKALNSIKNIRKFAKKVHKWEKNMKKCEERYPNSTNSTGMLPLYHPSQLIISVRISEGFKRQTSSS